MIYNTMLEFCTFNGNNFFFCTSILRNKKSEFFYDTIKISSFKGSTVNMVDDSAFGQQYEEFLFTVVIV